MGKEDRALASRGLVSPYGLKKITRVVGGVAVSIVDTWEPFPENLRDVIEHMTQNKSLDLDSGGMLNTRGRKLMELADGELKNYPCSEFFVRVYGGYGLQIILEPDKDFTNFYICSEISPIKTWHSDKNIGREVALSLGLKETLDIVDVYENHRLRRESPYDVESILKSDLEAGI